ncbi:hypothetical protein ACV1DR_23135 [Aeromonas jandaei]
MITAVILSLGLLGLVALQTHSKLPVMKLASALLPAGWLTIWSNEYG